MSGLDDAADQAIDQVRHPAERCVGRTRHVWGVQVHCDVLQFCPLVLDDGVCDVLFRRPVQRGFICYDNDLYLVTRCSSRRSMWCQVLVIQRLILQGLFLLQLYHCDHILLDTDVNTKSHPGDSSAGPLTQNRDISRVWSCQTSW